eukprot:scaffold65400_cov34-Attheya_sp.AAC.1
MMKLVTKMTDNAIRALTKRVLNLDLKMIAGENVTKATSLIRATLQRLETVGKMPPDMVFKLIEIFQSSSVDKFNKVFENLDIMIKIDDSKTYLADKILTMADEFYADFAEIWPHDAKHVGSTFIGDSDMRDCWNCGQKGHMSRDCPEKRSDSVGQDYSGGQDRGSGRGGGRYGGRFGGRGAGRGNGNGDSKQESPWYKKPPDRGEPHEITKNGRSYFWCGKQECSNWNTTHGMADHVVRANPAEETAPPTEQEEEEEGTKDKRQKSF